ncbi:MAG: hypothetical protein KIG36_05755 [Eubacteriales bacterium]|nr:hypothetical protein [Eubacteriales bacterium]
MLHIAHLDMPLGYPDGMLYTKAAEILRIRADDIAAVTITRRRLTGEPGALRFRISLDVALKESPAIPDEKTLAEFGKRRGVRLADEFVYAIPSVKNGLSPVVVGLGPAGLFAGLVLALAGAKPIILERGQPVEKRAADIACFRAGGIPDPESNYLFGEGGAGAFSDGKLKPGLPDAQKMFILREFVSAGAPPEILFEEKAHIGSDVLPRVVRNLRQKITDYGGQVLFNARLTGFSVADGQIRAVRFEQNGRTIEQSCRDVVLGIGHSARDTIEALYRDGIAMEAKGFGVGVRIEHPQRLLNRLRYGSEESARALGAADYHLVTHLPNGRSVYSFCMCPGGEVIPAVSEAGALCTNGMSRAARDGENGNAAILVSVSPRDFDDPSPLGGIAYQRAIEKRAFELAGGSYAAPAQALTDFLAGRAASGAFPLRPTYRPGVVHAAVEHCFPEYIVSSLKEGITEFDSWMPGFASEEAVLTAPETRSTSPVRILRDRSLQSPSVSGLYPCGEGAGYAGGILSAAVDGMRCAEAILDKFHY